MKEIKHIIGNTADEIWQQVSADLSSQDVYEYNVLLEQDGFKVELMIDIDLGGGFEGGYEYTTFKAPIALEHDFRFALHHENLIDTAGKFFGMEDIEIGYPEFDQELIIKTNDKDRTRQIFSDAKLREVFKSLHSFTLHLTHHHVDGDNEKQPFLELTIEEGITDAKELRNLYDAFYKVLSGIEAG